MSDKLDRFLSAQEDSYSGALTEIKAGKKHSHWMWFIFPQLAGLGISSTAQFYAITDLNEAKEYLNHPILGARLKEITGVLLNLKGKSATEIFGNPDDLKLRSSMTLFREAGGHEVFQQVLDQYFDGGADQRTLALLKA